MRYLLIVLLLSGCAATQEQEIPVAQMTPGVYGSEVAAMKAAAKEYIRPSIEQNREFIGGIYKTSSGYQYSVASGSKGMPHVTARLTVPTGVAFLSIWHTHAAANPIDKNRQKLNTRYFPSQDIELARKLNLPIYLVNYLGEIRKFTVEMPTYPYADGKLRYSKGELLIKLP